MKILFIILKILLLILLIVIILPYILCPFYKYPEIKPFSGKQYYNPYDKIDSTAWKKANFHTHSKQWEGLTAGSKNSEDTVAKKYKEIKYDIVGISDYQRINTFLKSDPGYIPVYEHGYGISKTHQLVIGGSKVSWKEFIFFQTFNNKQDMLLSLKKDDEVISVNHPHLRNAYPPEDLKYLKGYDLIEASSHSYFNAADLWDTALSAGNPVFVIADDDNHDIYDPFDYGYVYTMVNCKEINIDNVKAALRSGNTFGVELEPVDDTSPGKKIEQSAIMPVIRSCSIDNDTLKMKFSRLCDTIKLYGQNGVIRKTVLNTDSVSYNFKESDTYIRTEINQITKSNIYLNPVFRYSGTLERVMPEIDLPKTWINRFVYFVIILLMFYLYRRFKRKKSIGRK